MEITETHLGALDAAIQEYGFSIEVGGANHEVEGSDDTYANLIELASMLRKQVMV